MINELNKKTNFHISDIQKLHFGENKSFIIKSDDSLYLLKLYRKDRGYKQTPSEEIEFTKHLESLGVKTSNYIKFRNGDYIEDIDSCEASIQNIINGHMILKCDNDYYYQLGRDLKKLHSLTRGLKNSFNLPVYNFSNLIEKRWAFVKNANFIDQTDLIKIEDYKKLVFDEVGEKLDSSTKQFIHFDAHAGNLIFDNENTYFIDWEECGFGHYLLDLAVPCTHLLRDKNRISKIDSLLTGYDENIDRKELNLITMTKLLYSMTHIPTRLDILHEPDKIFKRYIEYFKLLSSEY
jgi:Ser/Thr protein kinase RdoA (MazF antagonist)